MKTTINDVAEQAGVSIKTVSRVMNNEPSVRAPTREKVLEVVKKLNYKPNAAARNLAGTKSYVLAYVYDNPNAYYVIDMQNGILSTCNEQGYELLIHPCDSSCKDVNEQIAAMIRKSRVAGLILTPPFSESPSFLDMLDELDVKYVRILSGNGEEDGRSPCVFIDDHQAAFNITEHLIRQGHTTIGFLGGDKDHNSSSERLAGYKAALKKHKIRIDRSLILPGKYSFESGVKGASKLLAKEQQPTAIFACNDEIAAGALFTARLMDIEVPKQLAITGFEDTPFSRQTWPPLTTAQQPTSNIASSATSMLIELTRGQKDSSTQNIFTPELVVRDSTTNG